MKIKITIKISILILFLILSINNVYAEDCFIYDGGDEYNYNNSCGASYFDVNIESIKIIDITNYKSGFSYLTYYAPTSRFEGSLKSTYNSYYEDIQLKHGSVVIASGKIGYYKADSTKYNIWMWIDLSTWNTSYVSTLSGSQYFTVYGFTPSYYRTNINGHYASISTANKDILYKGMYLTLEMFYGTYDYTVISPIKFKNCYINEFTENNEYYINVTKSHTGYNAESTINISNSLDESLYTETSLNIAPIDLFLFDNNLPYKIECNDKYGNYYFDYLTFESVDIPTLTTDKTYYNTSEIINISFNNINKIYNECYSSICKTPYELYILYPVTDEYKQYEAKYIYPLLYSLEDETISLNTSFLSPQNTYILGIVGTNGDYTQHDDILLFSDSFTVFPGDEYLSISCANELDCYTYNNADITIYYKINNNSDIIIKDNDNNIINIYYNIIGSGSILYHIPDDIQHLNTYPNWKVYLNNTEYSTSFNKGVTVYWSQFQTPTPTPIFTPQPTPDINISDEIDNLKNEISPIKDLIFGLSEIVIDNPDYNKDNIVDENEINHWFNSLIPICIIFLLIVLYVGLKKNRND